MAKHRVKRRSMVDLPMSRPYRGGRRQWQLTTRPCSVLRTWVALRRGAKGWCSSAEHGVSMKGARVGRIGSDSAGEEA